jgi:hypothetical protein
MDWLTLLNSLILGLIVVAFWLKAAHSDDANSSCLAGIALVLFVFGVVTGGVVWGAGLLFGWWGVPW